MLQSSHRNCASPPAFILSTITTIIIEGRTSFPAGHGTHYGRCEEPAALAETGTQNRGLPHCAGHSWDKEAVQQRHRSGTEAADIWYECDSMGHPCLLHSRGQHKLSGPRTTLSTAMRVDVGCHMQLPWQECYCDISVQLPKLPRNYFGTNWQAVWHLSTWAAPFVHHMLLPCCAGADC